MSSKERRDGNLIHRIDERGAFGRKDHYFDILTNIRRLRGVPIGNTQDKKNSKGHLNSLTVSLQFTMQLTGKICFDQICCNISLLLRPPHSMQILFGISLEGSRVF
jgi:hypothetical protein